MKNEHIAFVGALGERLNALRSTRSMSLISSRVRWMTSGPKDTPKWSSAVEAST
ncbi:MAG: hypothetical protein ACKVG4_16030 [Longimicrobiales bacterium]